MAEGFHLSPYLHISSLHNTHAELFFFSGLHRAACLAFLRVCFCVLVRGNEGEQRRESQSADGAFGGNLDQEAQGPFLNHLLKVLRVISGSHTWRRTGALQETSCCLHSFNWQVRKEETQPNPNPNPNPDPEPNPNDQSFRCSRCLFLNH